MHKKQSQVRAALVKRLLVRGEPFAATLEAEETELAVAVGSTIVWEIAAADDPNLIAGSPTFTPLAFSIERGERNIGGWRRAAFVARVICRGLRQLRLGQNIGRVPADHGHAGEQRPHTRAKSLVASRTIEKTKIAT